MSIRTLHTLYVDRIRLAIALMVPVLVLGGVLRVVLYVAFHDGGFDALALLWALLAGVVFDVLCTWVALAPVWFGLGGLRLGVLRRPRVRAAALAGFFSLLLFDATAQYLFFDEFNARYNHIALDYLIYPTEVFGNIQESYDVPLIAISAVVGGITCAWFVARRLRGLQFGPLPFAARWRAVLTVGCSVAFALAAMCWLPGEVSANRITSEVAQNGVGQLARAFVTAELDYEAYYETLPTAEARERAARVLGFPAPSAAVLARPAGEFELMRTLVPAVERGAANHLDVVVVLEESLGSNFVGVLGQEKKGLTPNFDRWSEEGLLFTNLVANGNRTVRGLEGVLCSFLPLPGDSIVKQPRSEGVASLAGVFAEHGYATCFLYGGYGIFDHMKPFMTANGWNEFIEQPDYPSDAFRTAWGVADEFIFDKLIERQEAARAAHEALFATVMSVSNHRPYDVPPGRVEGKKSRWTAVKYADWAIGHYLDAARGRGLLEHTIVLVVGDHGARVYGAAEIPVASYRIPALIVAPSSLAERVHGRRFERLCSQVDLAPTLVSLAGLRAEVPFLGRDLFAAQTPGPEGSPRSFDGPGRAFVQHNNDIGLLTDDVLVVLGLNRRTTFYRRDGRASDVLFLVDARAVTPAMRELEKDAAAVFQTADELFEHGRYRLPGATELAPR